MILRLQHQRPDGEMDSYFLKPGRRYHIGRGSGCEIRILDLKLSRKHCALEFSGEAWQVVDLLSTNGCTLNGEQIVGSVAVSKGNVIAAGSTTMMIEDIFAADMAPVRPTHNRGNESAGEADTEEVSRDIDSNSDVQLEQESLPDGPNEKLSKPSSNRPSGTEWELEPNSDPLSKTDTLVPHPVVKAKAVNSFGESISSDEPVRRPTAVFRATDLNINHEEEATKLHATPTTSLAPPTPGVPVSPSTVPSTDSQGTDSQERTFYITVLGRRIGPLTRPVARDLKARELKGTLTTADLEQYPLG
jgi:Inner membrane component of T3SS, cytoplasmic domain